MFLLVTAVGVTLGYVYGGLVRRRFGLKDWRRWTALTPFWVLAIAMSIALGAMNMRDLLPQAIQAFAMASFLDTALDSVGALRRRRVLERDGASSGSQAALDS